MSLYIIFGTPGSGKTTYASKIVYKNLKRGIPTLCNFKVKGGYIYDFKSDLGINQMEYCDLVFDEAAVFANSRNFKSFGQEKINWFSLYRHHHIRDIYIFSQSYENMDATIRRLANALYVIRRPWWFRKLIVLKRVSYTVEPNQETRKMEDNFFYDLIFFNRYCYMPKYWNMFDSWEAEKLQYKEWQQYYYDNDFYDSKGLKRLSKRILKPVKDPDRWIKKIADSWLLKNESQQLAQQLQGRC